MQEELLDEKIVKIVQDGDVNSFGVLVNRFEDKLLRYIKRFIFDASDSEDILQIVFIKTYTNLMSFNFNYKFSSWIYRITHNEVVNYIRKYQKRNIVEIDWDVFLPIDTSKDEIINSIDKENLENWLKDNLNVLDYKYKEVLVLYYFDGMSYKEISDILKIPIATIGVRIKRAKALMKNNYIKQIKNKN